MSKRTWVLCGYLVTLLLIAWFLYWAATSENTLWGRGAIYDRLEELQRSAKANQADPEPLDQLIRSLRKGGSFERTHAAIQIGRRRLAVVAKPLDSDEGGEIMARYAARHPLAARELCHIMGRPVRDGDYAAVGKEIPFLALLPG